MTDSVKRSDNFVIEFLKFPENVSNVLGKQVKSFSRPSITFTPTETKRRGFTYKDKGSVSFSECSMVLWDDENSVTSALLYVQIFRQLNRWKDLNGIPSEVMKPEERDYRFDVKITLFNALDEEVEAFVMKNCFIGTLNHDDPSMTEDTETTISLTLEYDNIEMKIFDDYVAMVEPPVV